MTHMPHHYNILTKAFDCVNNYLLLPEPICYEIRVNLGQLNIQIHNVTPIQNWALQNMVLLWPPVFPHTR